MATSEKQTKKNVKRYTFALLDLARSAQIGEMVQCGRRVWEYTHNFGMTMEEVQLHPRCVVSFYHDLCTDVVVQLAPESGALTLTVPFFGLHPIQCTVEITAPATWAVPRLFATGTSLCSPEDVYDKSRGRKTALRFALKDFDRETRTKVWYGLWLRRLYREPWTL